MVVTGQEAGREVSHGLDLYPVTYFMIEMQAWVSALRNKAWYDLRAYDWDWFAGCFYWMSQS